MTAPRVKAPRPLPERAARYQIAFGLVGTAAGVIGFYRARDLDLVAAKGAALGFPSYELSLMTYNRLGAIVATVLALLGLAAGLSRRSRLGWIAALGFAVIVVQGILQVRPEGDNVFGTSGQTIAFSLALALGFAVTARVASQSGGGVGTPAPSRAGSGTHDA